MLAGLKFKEHFIRPSLKVWFIYVCIFIAILCTKLFFLLEQQNFQLLWRCIVLYGAIQLSYLLLAHLSTSYSVNALEIIGRSGVFSKKSIRIPLNRITNYECNANFIERMLGLNNILIDTPGGTGYELKMARLKKQDSVQIIQHLRYLMGQQKVAEAGSNEELRSIREKSMQN